VLIPSGRIDQSVEAVEKATPAEPHPKGESQRLARYRAALDASFGIAPHLPDGATYVEGLRRADRARRDELEHQAE
jgi:hypothetical protein